MSLNQRVGVAALPVLLVAAFVLAQTPPRRQSSVSQFNPPQTTPPAQPPAPQPQKPAGPIAGPAGPAAAGRYQFIMGNHPCLVDTTSGAIWEAYTQFTASGAKRGWAPVATALDSSVPGTPNRFQGYTTGTGDALVYHAMDSTNGRIWTYTKGTSTTGSFPNTRTETTWIWLADGVPLENTKR
jgi:hypothetical protein